ncbi:hypothetical protein EOL72_02990 [Candidatus Falkowbacteria bacterium]|nr:hypothetical protein [Candidatus Falkowbacteria bacterium]
MQQIANFFQTPLGLGIFILWTLPWKGVALWKAATNKKKAWFVALLILNTLAILEILYIFVFSKEKKEAIVHPKVN